MDSNGNITGDYTKTVWLTDFASDSNVQVSTPQLVRIDSNKLLVLWTEGGTLKWIFLDGSGEQLTEIYSMDGGKLSDCVPVVQNGSVVWYVTENGIPVIYRLNLLQPDTVSVKVPEIGEPIEDEPVPENPEERVPEEPTPEDPHDDPDPNNPFTDVMKGAYYHDAVLWAANADPQITAGTSASTFSPDNICTRAQVVTFLWRAKGCPEPAANGSPVQNPYEDVVANSYCYKAVLWAVENNITAGTSKTTFSPNQACTRAQVVTFLWRTEGKPNSTTTNNPFQDVTDGYYYNAVLLAVKNKITAGTTKTTFSPNAVCNRGQIVTFLYRAFVK